MTDRTQKETTERNTERSPLLEVCAGSYEDCLAAWNGKAKRVELNSALSAGGLTPSCATLRKAKTDTGLQVICMVRPRAAGFCYSPAEKEVMFEEARDLLEAGADGIAFGFLNPDGSVDEENTAKMASLIHSYGPSREAVFHRAFDVTPDPAKAVSSLIACGIDRILTSGTKEKAEQGIPLIQKLQETFGDQIEFLAGSGVNAANAAKIIEETGIHQVHSSCKGYRTDPTTSGNAVSYSYLSAPHEMDYDIVDPDAVEKIIEALNQI